MGPKLSDEILYEERDDDAYSLFRDESEDSYSLYPDEEYLTDDFDELVEDEY